MALKLKKDIVERYQSTQAEAKKYTILLVDDETANLEELAAVLASDYNIITASSGAIALAIIQSMTADKQIHLIISDQKMPEMTGVELFEKTILLIPETIRIILTGFADMKAIIDAINRGAIYKFLTKPIGPFEVQVTVQRALEYFELTQNNQAAMNDIIEKNTELEHKVIECTTELIEHKKQVKQLNDRMEQQNSIVKRLLVTDELTQLYNRRYFNTLLPREIQRATDENAMIALLIFDMDCFRQYNNHYGHQKADDVLRTIGRLLKAQSMQDALFRLNGDEFGIILVNSTTKEALDFANKIRLAIDDCQIEHLFSEVAQFITASFGLINIAANSELDMDYCYKQASEALYQAKKSGKNNVICAA